MRAGAYVLFIDNNNSKFIGWFDKLAATYGVEIIRSHEGLHNLPYDEEKADLGDYANKFGSPKLRADVAHRFGVKKG